MNEKPIEMTKRSLEKLEKELRELETIKLPATIARVAKAREQGDLSENSEYHDARDEQEFTEVRIGEIQEILANAKVVKETTSKDAIGFGSQVTIEDQKGKSKTYILVGEYDDSAHNENTITSESPIGAALLGKTKGDSIEVTVPNGQRQYKITAIKQP